jgi:periplasmic protein CpxP/Spy
MIFRALASMLFAACIVLAPAVVTPVPAQDAPAGSAPDGKIAPAAEGDPAAARIKYLHDRLRITAEQEELWEDVGRAIRDSARDLAPLLKERFQLTTNGHAVDLLHAYEALGEAQLDSLKKIITAFDPLYASMSESQKKIADAILREGAQSAMIAGIPVVPPPFTSSLLYPSLLSGVGVPAVAFRPEGFHQFHNWLSSHPHFGRFHHR